MGPLVKSTGCEGVQANRPTCLQVPFANVRMIAQMKLCGYGFPA